MPNVGIQEKENEFRDFINKLLKAHEHKFLDESGLFSHTNLRETMENLCNIIADEVDADSCTIHLKLYDAEKGVSSSGVDSRWNLDEYLMRAVQKWKLKNEEREFHLRTGRTDLLSTLSFPYWKYPKGAAHLVATNNEGPWKEACLTGDKRLASLESGITTDIFQDNLARIMDTMSIRSSRHMRKLGGVDFLVWKNGNWRESFKNLYGSPIRIHPAGEVIGILKVENKRDTRQGAEPIQKGKKKGKSKHEDAVEKRINEILGESAGRVGVQREQSLTNFEKSILKFAEDSPGLAKEAGSNTEYRKISLLALAYIREDLTRARIKTGFTLGDLFFIPYPHGDVAKVTEKTRQQWRHLKSCVAENPAIQIMTKTIEDEHRLRRAVVGTDEVNVEAYESIRSFYSRLSQDLEKTLANGQSGYRTLRLEFGDLSVSNFRVKDGNVTLPHFCFKADVIGNRVTEGPIDIYIFAPPGRIQIDNMSSSTFEPECCSADLARVYKKLSGLEPARNPTSKKSRLFSPLFSEASSNGEWISLQKRRVAGQPQHKHSVVDLLVDRWAARIQALNCCVPVKEFSADDTKKLCWAALEIGKLVERQISYRASHSDDPAPLTAMEFYRIPISELCFVDDLRKRRDDTQKVKVHIDHHIQNILYTMHLQDAVRFTSRIKGHRSYLARLGERHEGFVRGNLAIWFYLLSLTAFVTREGDPSYSGPDETLAFLGNLVRFRKAVEGVVKSQPRLSLLDEDKSFFARKGNHLIGDTRFASPPLSEFRNSSRQRFRDLQKRVSKNLVNEGFVEQASGSGSTDDSTQGYTITDKVLENLILRQYEPYAIAATSLWCQLDNLIAFPEYLSFYQRCFSLRNFLAHSKRHIEDTPEASGLKEVFGEIWLKLIKYMEAHDTPQFLESLAESVLKRTKKPVQDFNTDTTLHLNPKGIYKRIRNLNHTLNQQRGLGHLEWDLGRFDLLGCRLTCLYKNQVFAAYEQLWNSGDPFWGMVTERMERVQVEEKHFIRDRPDGRQRWLSLRTKNFLEGEYYSLQISALVDPGAIHEGFWDRNRKGYNLRRVQCLLGRLFREFDKEGASKYKSLARTRHHLRWEYVDWYQTAAEVIRTKSAPPEKHDDVMVGFGSFLGEAAVDFLMERIDEYLFARDNSDHTYAEKLWSRLKEDFNALKSDLRTILEQGHAYTIEILRLLTEMDPNDLPFEVRGGKGLDIKRFCAATVSLYSELTKLSKELEWARVVEKERQYYRPENITGESRLSSVAPIIFVPDKSYEEKLGGIDLNCDQKDGGTAVKELYDLLAQLRLEQKRFLFHKTDGTHPGLSLREEDNVLYRIQNYVLLYDRDKNDDLRRSSDEVIGRDKQKDGFLRGWTSRGLFYYLRSLIPLEIQIRTMLADTLSEQYHDAIYKGAPPKGVDFPRKQMQKIAKKLDSIDEEMEMDFEDYINRRYFLSETQEPETKN